MRGSPELPTLANSAETDRKRFPHRFEPKSAIFDIAFPGPLSIARFVSPPFLQSTCFCNEIAKLAPVIDSFHFGRELSDRIVRLTLQILKTGA
jgi:hypothetical protein